MLRGLALTICLLILGGCSRWSATSHDLQTFDRIDKRIEIGMSMADFRQVFPEAKLWGEQGDRRRYLVVVDEDCFRCYSAAGFTTSHEYYARIVQFEGDRLATIAPVELSR